MKQLFFLFLVFLGCSLYGQVNYTSLNAHSHNDYAQKTPFFLAYNAGFGSIEADIWAVNGELFVAHDRRDISADKTLDKLYLQPIVKLFHENGGKAWKGSEGTFQLLIDFKTEVAATMPLLVAKLEKYPGVFNPAVNPHAVRVTITGNRPGPDGFSACPGFIFFDGNLFLKYDKTQLSRIALYSENLVTFTKWRGTEAMPAAEELRLKQVIDSVHNIGKTVRFWNAPDVPEAWKKLMSLKVDYINTDHINELAAFLKNKKQ